jgi:NAD(P)-dependent dehydrogenase (short-subunit alcohol dehydrogenase family)
MMTGMVRSHVVTGAGRGVGRAIAERLLSDGDAVVVLEREPEEVAWVAGHPAGPRVVAVTDSADDLATAERAADAAEDSGILSGWVNNVAIFRDADLHTDAPDDILSLISERSGSGHRRTNPERDGRDPPARPRRPSGGGRGRRRVPPVRRCGLRQRCRASG